MKSPWALSRRGGSRRTNGDPASRALLISIQPRFANAIIDGTKWVELRRTMPTLAPGALALIYSSSPAKALIGWATIDGILSGTPSALWNTHHGATGVTSDEFADYFAGRPTAFGLQLSSVRRANSEVSLTALRTHGLQPPQSWRYLTADLAQALLDEMSGPSSSQALHSRRQLDLAAIAG